MDRDPGEEKEMPAAWLQWYRLARSTLGYSHSEAVVYANVRYTEDENLKAIRDRPRAA
jgi:hypothetical protein